MNINPNGPYTAPLIGEARRFSNKKQPANSRIFSEKLYAQDADGIKYVYPSAIKAAADLIKYKFVCFRDKEKLNDPMAVREVAREVIRATDGKARNKQGTHRYCGFDWFFL